MLPSICLAQGDFIPTNQGDLVKENDRTYRREMRQPIAFPCTFNLPLKHRFLTKNPLSQFWIQKMSHRSIAYPALYCAGMVGYATALPLRIRDFVIEFFRLIAVGIRYTLSLSSLD